MKLRYVLEEQAGATGAAGGGGDAGEAAAAAAAAAAGGGDKGGDKGSLLSSAAGADAAAAAAAAALKADPLGWVPEKYRVFEGDGAAKKFNLEQSARKVAEAHVALEKRMGDTGLPPEKADGYKTDTVLAAMKAKAGDKAGDVKLPDGLVKEFNGWAHAAKLTQAQYDSALGSYLGGIQTMVDTAFDNAMATAKDELTKVWGAAASDPKSPQMQAAFRAFKTYAPAALRTQEVMDKIGNNPIVMQVLAAVGAELGEDTRPHGEGTGGEDIGALMKTPAYWNKKHPEHDSTVKKVNAFFAAGGKAGQPKAA